MNVTLTDAERELLLELLEAKYTHLLHEIHHTDTYNYKDLLKQQAETIEKLKAKFTAGVAV